ncbi:MAG: hypothetical protein JNK04_01855 [Myxococcales bacterium]|nr:hypothetical protein [Myxococcales bacterium]
MVSPPLPRAWLGLLLTVACAEVIDLQEAELDPALAQGGAPGGDRGGGGDGGAGLVDAALCATYCDAVQTSCTGAFAVYGSRDACLAVCAALPAGEPGDVAGNTIQCRLASAASAAAEPAYYCASAGPSGNGVCGSSCDALCSISEAVCTGDAAQWSSTSACMADCADLADLETYSVDPAAAMYAGDHVQCRIFHASASALADPHVHCAHAGGEPPCAPEPIGGAP